jgi:hypothetical protein
MENTLNPFAKMGSVRLSAGSSKSCIGGMNVVFGGMQKK